ncbi:MAG: SUMF1/EgtB/PvdO family nonheme iron enzyme [Myxococcota bacterium]
MVRRIPILALLMGAFGLAACGDDEGENGDDVVTVAPTSIVVALSTDLAFPEAFDRIYVSARRVFTFDSEPYERTFGADELTLPNTIVFTCSDSNSGTCDSDAIELTVAARRGETLDVVTRTARVNYANDRAVVLPIPLCSSCEGVTCDDRETCQLGVCVPDVLDGEALADDDPNGPVDYGDECATPLSTSCNGDNCGGPTVDVGGFRIDAFEVTRQDYRAFLASRPSRALNDDREACAWNNRFLPDESCMNSACDSEDEDCSLHPQICVDFCDAAAYCRWAGKRLCGARTGGSIDAGEEDSASTAVSQWSFACGEGYPYGDTYIEQQCNDAAASRSGTLPVGSASTCVALSGQIFDLSGNAAEWEDSCTTFASANDPAGQTCRTRGGSYSDRESNLACLSPRGDDRNTTSPTIGFRCCSI